MRDLIAEGREAAVSVKPQREKLPAKVYAVMAMTTALTFGTLTTGYELFFVSSPFA